MANPIPERQSSSEIVTLAAAFRQAYDDVKSSKFKIWTITLILAVCQLLLSLKFEIISHLISIENLTVVMVAILIATLFFNTLYKFLFIDPLQQLACNIQQLHEFKILELGQPPSFTEARPAKINSLGEKWLKNNPHDRHYLELWWPRSTGQLPFTHGKLICLISTFQWESQLRKHYQTFLVLIIVFVVLLSAGIMYCKNFVIEQYIGLIFVPITPFIELVLQESLDNSKSASTAKEAAEKCLQLWNLLLEKKISTDNAESKMQVLLAYWQQHYRLTATPIFGWLYWLSLQSMDKEMTVDAEDLIKSYSSLNP